MPRRASTCINGSLHVFKYDGYPNKAITNVIYLRGGCVLKWMDSGHGELRIADHSIKLSGIPSHVTYLPSFKNPAGGPLLGYCDCNLDNSGFRQWSRLGEQRKYIPICFKIWHTSALCIRW